MTAHWIAEDAKGKWSLKTALLGFTRLNNSHNGIRLGQALFRIVDRVEIASKVSLSGSISMISRLTHYDLHLSRLVVLPPTMPRTMVPYAGVRKANHRSDRHQIRS